MDTIYETIEFQAKKHGEGHARHLLDHLQGENEEETFGSMGNLKMAILEIMGKVRESVECFAKVLNIQHSEMNELLSHLANQKLRADILGKTYANRVSAGNTPRNGQQPTNPNTGGGKGGDTNPKGDRNVNQKAGVYGPGAPTKKACYGCGIMTIKHGLKGSECPFIIQKHPNANTSTHPWDQSNAGKAAKAKNAEKLTWQETLDGKHFKMEANYKGSGESSNKRESPGNQGGNGESLKWALIIEDLAALEGVKPSPILSTTTPKPKIINPFLTTHLVNLHNRQGQQVRKEVKTVLVDTGAIDSNYISSKMTRSLEKLFGVVRESDVREVKTPDRSAPKFYTEGSVVIEIEIYNEIDKKMNVIKIKALIIDSPIDLIIGLPTIRENDLLLKCMNQILWGTREKWVTDKQVTPIQFKESDASMLNSMVDAMMNESKDQTNEPSQTDQAKQKETFTNCVACYTLVSHEECA